MDRVGSLTVSRGSFDGRISLELVGLFVLLELLGLLSDVFVGDGDPTGGLGFDDFVVVGLRFFFHVRDVKLFRRRQQIVFLESLRVAIAILITPKDREVGAVRVATSTRRLRSVSLGSHDASVESKKGRGERVIIDSSIDTRTGVEDRFNEEVDMIKQTFSIVTSSSMRLRRSHVFSCAFLGIWGCRV